MTAHTSRFATATPFVTASLLLVLFGGCARPVAPSPSAPASTSAQAPASAEPAEPVARPPEGCLVRHEGVCYPTREAACEAAACPLDRCALNKSLPASISCIAR